MIGDHYIEALADTVVRHSRFYDTEESILEYVELAAEDDILAVIGPTGAGKSTVIGSATNALDGDTGSGSGAATVVTDAPAAEGTPFRWKAFYALTLEAMGEVGIPRKVAYDEREDDNGNVTVSGVRAANIHDMGRIVEQAFEDWNPPAWIIDECQHIGDSPSGRVKASNLDVIKRHRSRIRTPIVLVGTYQAQDMLCYTGQMSRRVRFVHFQPYYPNSDDVKEFVTIIDSLIEKLEIPISFSISANAMEIHRRSVGCVGIFVSWLRYALQRAKRREKDKLTLDVLWGTKLSDAAVATIAAEIDAFDEFNGNARRFSGLAAQSRAERRDNGKGRPQRDPGRPYPRRSRVGDG